MCRTYDMRRETSSREEPVNQSSTFNGDCKGTNYRNCRVARIALKVQERNRVCRYSWNEMSRNEAERRVEIFGRIMPKRS